MADIEIAQLVDRLMRRIHSALNERAHEFDTHGVGPLGGIVLLTLAEMHPATMQDLTQRMARDKSQMTRSVKVLVDKGLVSRKAVARDARICELHLTDEGHATVAKLQHAVANVLETILAPLEPEDRESLREILRAI